MTDYDERAREAIDRNLKRAELDVRASAEEDEKDGPLDHPFQHVDSESLASHNLRIIRKQLDISQQQIADRLPHVYGGMVRLAQTQIAKIERGERPWRVNEMFAIAEALGVEWHEFFRGGPKFAEENDDHLLMLGARNKYKQAKDKADQAKEAWISAATEELKAGMEMARTAARLGIEDPTVLRFLEFRGATNLFMELEDQAIADRWASETFDLDARIEEVQERGRNAWELLLKEAEEQRNETSTGPQEED
jgi:transcriptional regulator with XRE-family HTH domain